MKRPIDRMRDSGKSSNIGVDGDVSAITDMVVIDEKMHIVKEEGIYLFLHADDIDPERTNEKIPDTQQRVLAVGSKHPTVAKVLLTANTLFIEHRFDPSVDFKRALSLAFSITKDLVELERLKTEFLTEQERCEKNIIAHKHEGGAYQLPSVGNLSGRFDSYTQKLGHVVKSMQKLAEVFFGDQIKSKWIESLTSLAEQRYGAEDMFTQFLKQLGPIMLNWLNIRNAVEHPSDKNIVALRDYHYLPEGGISPPTVEITSNGKHLGLFLLSDLIVGITDSIPTTVEVFIANLAAVNLQTKDTFPVFVDELPEDQRSNKLQRFYYALNMGGRITRLG
jgi:hypothetical protein